MRGRQHVSESASMGKEIPPLAEPLPTHCRRDVDTLRRFVDQAAGRATKSAPVAPSAFQDVLLTGVTGFLGRFLLRDLLRRVPGLRAHCLVRARDAEHGKARVQATMEEADIWDEEFASRIQAIPGDITESQFGLDRRSFASLCERIDAVYHLAADVSVISSYSAIRGKNSFSIRPILDLCLTSRMKPLFHASTMGVFPEFFFGFGKEFAGRRITHQMQPDIGEMKRVFPLGILGYPWTKLVVEQALLHAHRAGVPLGIFRLPHSPSTSTGFAKHDDPGVRLLAAIVDVGKVPEGFTLGEGKEAADTVSRVMAAISLNPRRRFLIYQCCNAGELSEQAELADFGMDYQTVPYGEFKRACRARGEESPLHGLWGLLDHAAPYWFAENKTPASLCVSSRAVDADCPDRIVWPSVSTLMRRTREWRRSERVQWPYPLPESRLDHDILIGRARAHADTYGVAFDSVYPERMRSAMKRLVESLKKPESVLRKEKFGDIAFDMSRLLRTKAAIAAERLRCPSIADQQIRNPVFIVGANRSGTTYLHRLMARDPNMWAVRGYEFAYPILPGGDYRNRAGTASDPRIVATEELFDSMGLVERFRGIHHFDVMEPEEDLSVLRMGFAAWSATVRFHVPGFGRWLAGQDARELYVFHRQVMQHYTYQRRQRVPPREGRWVLKNPLHLFELESLVDTYPDAIFIQMHREPTQFMGSWISLVKTIRSILSKPLPPEDLGAEQLAFMSRMLDSAVAFRTAHPELEDQWLDISFYDMVRYPMAVVAHIYDRFGWSLGPEALNAMDEWLDRQAAHRRKQKRHRYDIADYGLTREMVAAAFSRYREFLAAGGRREAMMLG